MRIRHIPGRSKPWCLDLGEIAGKRQRLFFKKKGDAEKQMQLRERVTERHGEDALTLSIPDRLELITFRDECIKLGVTPMHVLLFYKAHAKGFHPKPLADAVNECAESKQKTGKRPKYVGAIKRCLQSLARIHPGALCHNITQSHIEAWARAGKHGPVSLATTRGKLIDAKTFFNFCLKRKWVLENPVEGVEQIQLEDKPPGIHTIEQVKALLGCALEHDPALIGYLAPIYFGGLRPDEARRLAKEDVHLGLLEVRGPKAKTRRRRLVKINATLAAWLAVPGVEYGISSRTRRIEKLRWILGGKKMRRGKGRMIRVVRGFPWSQDIMRHSFCSYGVPIFGAREVSEMAGHSERVLFAHYRERVKPTDAQSYWNLLPAK